MDHRMARDRRAFKPVTHCGPGVRGLVIGEGDLVQTGCVRRALMEVGPTGELASHFTGARATAEVRVASFRQGLNLAAHPEIAQIAHLWILGCLDGRRKSHDGARQSE
jgi:hypothetical protein